MLVFLFLLYYLPFYILLINNQKLIGIHYGTSKNSEINEGTLLIYSIIEFQKINTNLLIINKEGDIIENTEINNCIIGEFDIKEIKNR